MKKTRIALLTLALLLAAGCAGSTEPIAMDAAAPPPDAAAAEPDGAQPAPFTDVQILVRRDGETVSTRTVTAADEIEAAERIVFDYMVKSAAWEGVEVSALSDYIALSYDQTGGERQTFYQFESEGRPVLQCGEAGMYTVMGDEAYALLLELAELAPESGMLPAPYAAIIAQYADAVRNGYYEALDAEERDAVFGACIAQEWRIHPQPAFYALSDLDGDGVLELLIAAGEDPAQLAYYDIWCCADGQAVRPFDMDFGYRVGFDVYADGRIEVRWANSAFESGYDYYRISGAAAEPIGSLVAAADPESGLMEYRADGEAIDEAEFEQRRAAHASAGALPLDWISVTAAD